MSERLVIVLRPHPDRRGRPYMRVPFREEGPAMVPYKLMRRAVWDMLRNHGEPFTLLEDFTEIHEWHVDHTFCIREKDFSDAWSRPHHPDLHWPGSFCSNCIPEEIPQVYWEDPDDDVWRDDPMGDDPFAEERAEDLREAVQQSLIEHHADCASCGGDFILSSRQVWEMSVGISEQLLCPACMDRVR